MLRHAATVLLALSTVLSVGCAQDDASGPSERQDAREYVDGASARTSHGAFEATLFSEAGEAVAGTNLFYLRVAMPDPNDVGGEGWGVPQADITAEADCDEEVRGAVDQRITYQGGGTYEIDAVELGRGTCELVFDIEVGETIHESVSFFFVVE